jgi:hypothetical protein
MILQLVQAVIAFAGYVIDNLRENRPERASQCTGFAADATHIPAFDQTRVGAFKGFLRADFHAKGLPALAAINGEFGDFQQTELAVIATMKEILAFDLLNRIACII